MKHKKLIKDGNWYYNTPSQVYSGEIEANKVVHYSKRLKKVVAVRL